MITLDKIKGARKSITIWFNTVILTVLPVLDYAKDSLPSIQDYLTPDNYKTIGLVIVATNIMLRFKTDKCLSDK